MDFARYIVYIYFAIGSWSSRILDDFNKSFEELPYHDFSWSEHKLRGQMLGVVL